MLLSVVSVLVVAQSTSEIPEGIMNNPVYFPYLTSFDLVCGEEINNKFLKSLIYILLSIVTFCLL